MARPREYTPLRRWVMQGALGLVLVLCIVLAGWIDRQHAASLSPPLSENIIFGNSVGHSVLPLNVAVPKGFSARRLDHAAGLVLTEQHATYGIKRKLFIAESWLPRRKPLPSPEARVDLDTSHEAADLPATRFDFLGGHGVLVTVPMLIEETEQDGTARVRMPYVMALSVIPNPPSEVWIQLRGPREIAPADIDLVRRIAKSLTPAPSSAAPTELPTLEGSE